MSKELTDRVKELFDAIILLLNAEMTSEEKLALFHSACFSDVCRELTTHKGLGALVGDSSERAAGKKELLSSAARWMLSFEEIPDDEFEKYCELGELISAVSESENSWLIFKRLYVEFLIEQGRLDEAILKITELEELLPDDVEVQDMAKKYKGVGQIQKCAEISGRSFKKPRPNTGCDNEFYALIQQLKTSSLEQLLSNAATWANKWVEEDHEYYGLLLKWYRNWYGVGLFGQDQGFINYFGGMYQYLKQNADSLAALYDQMADHRSKLTLKTILQHWMTFHPDLRKNGREVQFSHYFDLDILECDENEVFVDCGCFDGGTVKEFIHDYGAQYKSIYSYELTSSSFELAKARLNDVPRLYLRNTGVSDKNGTFTFQAAEEGRSQAANRLSPNGNAIAKVVKIDDDIQEDITFIKMDIKGAELEALRGAEQQIRRNKPKLAISLYHKVPDLLDIPKLIKSYVPEYKLYLRHNYEGENSFPFPSEYVLLARV